DGTIRPGWPVDTKSLSASSPAIGDIDKNGRFDIVIGSGNKVYALHENGLEMDGWPIATGGNIVATPALGDIDNDGKLEVIIGSRDGYMYVYKWDGSIAKGWPVKTESYINSSAALGDIDGDRKLEIVMASGNGAVYAFNDDGTIVNGWPIATSADIYSSPALGDIDGDGDLEIVIADKNGYVHAWHHNGQNVNGWPVSLREDIEASPALGDIDGDKNTLEIVIGTLEGSIYVLKNNGTPMNGWPVPIMDSIFSSPTLADIDGDGEIEIIVASSTGYRYVGLVHAFRKTGERLSYNWPIYIEGNIKYSSPVIADLDGDGDIELAIGSCRLPNLVGGKVHVWDLEGRPDPEKIIWNGFRKDSLRTGAVKDSIPPSLLLSILRDYIKKRRVTLYATASEKINESLMLTVELGEGKDKKILQSIPMVLLNEKLLIFRASFKPEAYGKYTFTVTGADLYGNIGYVSKSIFIDSPFKTSQQPSIIPEKFALLPNFPNPFNPYTWIPYELHQGSNVTIEIYSLDGKLICSLNIGYQPAGAYTNKDTAAYWDGTDNSYQPVASGVYFCVLRAGNFKATRKMLLGK
ncbi:T9SS type A sorting domain-containing protein, partial [Candidatus Poribacteria bacterium]|nr:T9SS type A sorting domain-containing protein [Candidatus Poribacteria bacterium]